MDLRPWNYWTNAGKPRAPSTLETVKVLEGIVNRRLDHPGACHFYIHAIEASSFPERALPCAERLGSLVPGAGHLVHMPTHIYMRLGRWDDAVAHNATAVHVDQEYVAARHPTGVYPLGYVPHNYHVMWEALLMLGRSREALAAARTIQAKVPLEARADDPALRVLLAGGAVHAGPFLPLGRRAEGAGAGAGAALHHGRVALRARAGVHRGWALRLGHGRARQRRRHCDQDPAGPDGESQFRPDPAARSPSGTCPERWPPGRNATARRSARCARESRSRTSSPMTSRPPGSSLSGTRSVRYCWRRVGPGKPSRHTARTWYDTPTTAGL